MSAAVWAEPPRMTLRVSRDGGRTWGPLHTITTGDPERLPTSIGYPPCQCPQHRAEPRISPPSNPPTATAIAAGADTTPPRSRQ